MIAQNASSGHSGATQFQSFGNACTNPADALENAKAVVSFLEAAICNSLSDRASELDGRQIFGISLIFQATLASLDYATTGMRTRGSQDDAQRTDEVYRNGYAAGLEEGKRLSAAVEETFKFVSAMEAIKPAAPYPRFDQAPDPEQETPPGAAVG